MNSSPTHRHDCQKKYFLDFFKDVNYIILYLARKGLFSQINLFESRKDTMHFSCVKLIVLCIIIVFIIFIFSTYSIVLWQSLARKFNDMKYLPDSCWYIPTSMIVNATTMHPDIICVYFCDNPLRKRFAHLPYEKKRCWRDGDYRWRVCKAAKHPL